MAGHTAEHKLQFVDWMPKFKEKVQDVFTEFIKLTPGKQICKCVVLLNTKSPPAIPGVTDTVHKPISSARVLVASPTVESLFSRPLTPDAAMDVDDEVDDAIAIAGPTPYESDQLRVIKRNQIQMKLLGIGGPLLPPKKVKTRTNARAALYVRYDSIMMETNNLFYPV